MSSDPSGAEEPPVLEQGDSIVARRPFFSGPAGKIFIIWFLMTTVGVLIGIFAPHHLLPTLLSTEGTDVWRTMVLFTILAAPVAAFVYAVAAYSLIGWRHRGNQDEPPEDGPPLRGNSTVTAIWLGVSSVLVLVLLAWGLAVYSAESVSPPHSLQIDVTGQQWVWTFSYPGTGVETRSLVLPINRPVQFNVTSVDVTHGFWPVDLGVQVDANPGVVTVIRATPDKLGKFTVRCSQLCGLYHSFMYAPGSVVTAAQFSQWLQSEGASTTTAQATALVKQ
ncbi:MAG TPA: cytochrome c oxidase subunit II [Acidimicrobiales bacterium]|jgi:cytochrome c oxidase subunit 2